MKGPGRYWCWLASHLPRNLKRGVLVVLLDDHFPESVEDTLNMPIEELLVRFDEDAGLPEARAGEIRPVLLPEVDVNGTLSDQVWPIETGGRKPHASDPGS